jgi:hypothetical protein
MAEKHAIQEAKQPDVGVSWNNSSTVPLGFPGLRPSTGSLSSSGTPTPFIPIRPTKDDLQCFVVHVFSEKSFIVFSRSYTLSGMCAMGRVN